MSAAAVPLLAVDGLCKSFGGDPHFLRAADPLIRAVDGVSFHIGPGEVVGLVGESGSGKTTVGRAILRLTDPTAGQIVFEGTDITNLGQKAMRPFRQRMQIVFQDPFASLNPRLRIDAIIGEALGIRDSVKPADRDDLVVALLKRVGLSAQHLRRFPHEFSGGQRQRIVIARALAVEPKLIVADEPVSALDVSIQAQIVNLLADLQNDFGLSMLFISHDLGVVEYISDRVIVMYLGRIMEVAPTESLFAAPRHPYTEALLSAAPVPDPDRPRQRTALKGDIPSPANPPSGCVFRTRCPMAIEDCAKIVPPLRQTGDQHFTACIRVNM